MRTIVACSSSDLRTLALSLPRREVNVLSGPEIRRAVNDEKAELAAIYRDKARTIVESINSTNIADASLQQKAVSTDQFLRQSGSGFHIWS